MWLGQYDFYKSEQHAWSHYYDSEQWLSCVAEVQTRDSQMRTLPLRHKAPQKMKNNFTENEFQTKTIGGIDILKTLVEFFSKS